MRLDHLRSWTTVGSPFLTFAPTIAEVWWPIAGAFLLGAAYLGWNSFARMLLQGSSLAREGALAAMAETTALFAMIVLVAVFVAFRAFIAAVRFIGEGVNARSEARASSWYEDQWLAIWHIDDEPMAALAATLSRPPSMLPRILDKGAASFLLKPYNNFFAAAADENAWAILMGKVQGDDILGLTMASASCAPGRSLKPWPPLPRNLLRELSLKANVSAATIISQARRRLRRAAKANLATDAVLELVRTLDWNAVIHTSYFDNAGVRRLIERHILVASSCAAVSPDVSNKQRKLDYDAWVTSRNRLRPPRRRVVSARLNSAWLRAGFTISIGLLILVSMSAVFDRGIEPYLRETQSRRIAERSFRSDFINFAAATQSDENPSNVSVEDIIVRLVILRAIPATAATLQPIKNTVTRSIFAQRVAYALGVEGRIEEAEKFLADLDASQAYYHSDVYGVVGLQLLAGLVRGGHKPSEALIGKVAEALANRHSGTVFFGRAELTVAILAALSKDLLVPPEFLQDFDPGPNSECGASARAAQTAIAIQSAVAVRRALSLCNDADALIRIKQKLVSLNLGNGEIAKLLIDERVRPDVEAILNIFRLASLLRDETLSDWAAKALEKRWDQLSEESLLRLDRGDVEKLRRTWKPEAVAKLLDIIVERAKERMTNSYGEAGLEETFAYARALGTADRRKDLEEFQRELGDTPPLSDGPVGRCDEINGYLRIASIRVASGEAEAAKSFVLKALEKDNWTDDRCRYPAEYIEFIRRHFAAISGNVGYDAALAAKRQAAASEYLLDRRRDAANTAQFFATISADYQAAQTGIESSDPVTTIVCFAAVMDVWIELQSSGATIRHGLADGVFRPPVLGISTPSPF